MNNPSAFPIRGFCADASGALTGKIEEIEKWRYFLADETGDIWRFKLDGSGGQYRSCDGNEWYEAKTSLAEALEPGSGFTPTGCVEGGEE